MSGNHSSIHSNLHYLPTSTPNPHRGLIVLQLCLLQHRMLRSRAHANWPNTPHPRGASTKISPWLLHVLRIPRSLPRGLPGSPKRRGSSGEGGVRMSRTQIFPSSKPCTQLQTKLTWSGRSFKSFALVDSGAESFIDSALVLQMGIPAEPLDILLEANALNGHLLAQLSIRPLLLSGNHSETLRLHIISLPQAPIVLGHP